MRKTPEISASEETSSSFSESEVQITGSALGEDQDNGVVEIAKDSTSSWKVLKRKKLESNHLNISQNIESGDVLVKCKICGDKWEIPSDAWSKGKGSLCNQYEHVRSHTKKRKVINGPMDDLLGPKKELSEQLQDAITELFIGEFLPFKFVESPLFLKVLKIVHEMDKKKEPLHIPSRKTLKKDVIDFSRDMEKNIIEELSKVDRVNLILDAWTSKSYYSFIAIIAGFNDSNFTYQERLLSFEELSGHSGAEMGSMVCETIEKFKMTQKIVYLIMDNASSNNTLASGTRIS
jgi:hypothetical protein